MAGLYRYADPTLFLEIAGTTDSEVLFFLALTFGLEHDPPCAMARAAGLVERVARESGVDHPLRMTVAVSNGERVWAFRYARDGPPASLFHTDGVETLRAQFPDNPLCTTFPTTRGSSSRNPSPASCIRAARWRSGCPPRRASGSWPSRGRPSSRPMGHPEGIRHRAGGPAGRHRGLGAMVPRELRLRLGAQAEANEDVQDLTRFGPLLRTQARRPCAKRPAAPWRHQAPGWHRERPRHRPASALRQRRRRRSPACPAARRCR